MSVYVSYNTMSNQNKNKRSFLVKLSLLMLLLVLGKGVNNNINRELAIEDTIDPISSITHWIAKQPGFTLIDKIKNI